MILQKKMENFGLTIDIKRVCVIYCLCCGIVAPTLQVIVSQVRGKTPCVDATDGLGQGGLVSLAFFVDDGTL